MTIIPLQIKQRAQELAREHPHDIVAVYGMDETCIWASPSHSTILGYSQADMAGQHWTKFIAPEDRPHADLTGADALLNGRSVEVGLRAVTKGGDRVRIRGRAWIGFEREAGVGFLFFQATPV